MWVLIPAAGITTPIWRRSTKRAMKPRKAGNTWMRSSAVRPARLPRNRSLLNANAASEAMKRVSTAATSETFSVFNSQVPNGVSGFSNRPWKFSKVAPSGISCANASESTGLIDELTIHAIGKSAKSTPSTRTRCRRPRLADPATGR